MPTFWSNVIYTLTAKRLLVQVFRFDNEKKAITDYIDGAKEAIQDAFKGEEDKYQRFSLLLHRP